MRPLGAAGLQTIDSPGRTGLKIRLQTERCGLQLNVFFVRLRPLGAATCQTPSE